jgi:hypothetical protein
MNGRLEELIFRRNHCSTTGIRKLDSSGFNPCSVDFMSMLNDIGNEPLTPTNLMTLKITKINAILNSRQASTLFQVVVKMLVEPVERAAESFKLYVEHMPSKDEIISALAASLSNHEDNTRYPLYASAPGSELTVRHFSYHAEQFSWVLIDDSLLSHESVASVDHPGKFLEATLLNLKGLNLFSFDSSHSFVVELQNLAVIDELHKKQVLVPNPTHWEARDPQTKAVRIWGKIAPPCPRELLVEENKFLSAIIVWQHLEMKVFPLSIDISQDMYEVVRRYFLGDARDDDVDFISGTGKSLKSSKGSSVTSKKSSTKGTSIEQKLIEFPALNYFKHLRLNDALLTLSYNGFITISQLDFRLDHFVCNHKLWSWGKTAGYLERHMKSCVLRHGKDIVRHTLGFKTSTEKMKERHTASDAVSYFGGMVRKAKSKILGKKGMHSEPIPESQEKDDESSHLFKSQVEQ